MLAIKYKRIQGSQGISGGGAPSNATFITQTPDASLTNEQALSTLSTGLLKNTTGTRQEHTALDSSMSIIKNNLCTCKKEN